MKYLDTVPESWWMKIHGSAFQITGVPDIMGIISGHGVGFEVKVPGNKRSTKQIYMGGKINDAGGMVFTVHNVTETRLCIELIQSHLSKYWEATGRSTGLVLEISSEELAKIKPKKKKKTKPVGDGGTPFG